MMPTGIKLERKCLNGCGRIIKGKQVKDYCKVCRGKHMKELAKVEIRTHNIVKFNEANND